MRICHLNVQEQFFGYQVSTYQKKTSFLDKSTKHQRNMDQYDSIQGMVLMTITERSGMRVRTSFSAAFAAEASQRLLSSCSQWPEGLADQLWYLLYRYLTTSWLAPMYRFLKRKAKAVCNYHWWNAPSSEFKHICLWLDTSENNHHPWRML